MKSKLLKYSTVFLIALFLFQNLVSANSSWTWISSTRPIDVLPFIIIVTLLIESLVIIKVNKIKAVMKTVIIISVANAVSFVLPFLLLLMLAYESGFSWSDYFIMITNNHPTYIVGIAHIILTLLIEVPIVYVILKKEVENEKKLLMSIVAVNLITTAFVAIVERIITVGQWI